MSGLDETMAPVAAELRVVERHIRDMADRFAYSSTREIAGRFFDSPGKFLRPALVLLSAKTIREDIDAVLPSLVQTAVGVELIHAASLIHDDIIDGDTERRGRPTVHRVWGTKIALLMGDALYSRAFAILTEALPQDLLLRVVRMNEGMCAAEIESAHRGAGLSREEYMNIIEGKTASFMSVCCLLGARLAGANREQTQALERFGLCFGMGFQLLDDAADNELAAGVGIADAEKLLDEARTVLRVVPEGRPRSSLEALCAVSAESFFSSPRRVP